MNIGYIVLGLGVLGIIAGAVLYATGVHPYLGPGGIVVGIVLVLIGILIARGTIMGGSRAPPA